MKRQMPRAVFQRKRAGCARNTLVNVAGIRAGRKSRLAKRKPEHRRNRLLRPVFEIQKRRGKQAHIGVVRNRQGKRILAVINQVIVPFLDAKRAAANRLSVIGFHERGGISCLAERAGRIKKRSFGKKMLHRLLPPAGDFISNCAGRMWFASLYAVPNGRARNAAGIVRAARRSLFLFCLFYARF